MENIDQLNLTGKQLKLFLAVFDSNSVSRASEQLGLNQSTVSYGLDRLRDVLGDPLFVKSGRGITPTDRSIMLAPIIRSIVQNMESLAGPARYDPRLDRTTIAISANVMELLPTLRRLFFRLREEAPHARVRLLELGSRDNIRHLLDDNMVDLVISIRSLHLANSLKAETVLESEIVCFYDPNERGPIKSIEDYAKADHAALDFGGESKSTIDLTLEKMLITRNVVFRTANAYALGNFMRGTPLVASMQKSLGDMALADLAHCPHPLDVPPATFDIVWHRRNDNAPRSLWLRDIVKQTFAGRGKPQFSAEKILGSGRSA